MRREMCVCVCVLVRGRAPVKESVLTNVQINTQTVTSFPPSLPRNLPVESHEERDRCIQDVHHAQRHDWDIGALPDQREEQGQEGLGDGRENGVMLGAEADAGLGEEAAVDRGKRKRERRTGNVRLRCHTQTDRINSSTCPKHITKLSSSNSSKLSSIIFS